MKENLLLLDADIIISLHKMGLWKGVLANYKVHVSSIVMNETEYYEDAKGRYNPIDLRSATKNKEIVELMATPQELSEVLNKIKHKGLDGLDPGELESITIIINDTDKTLKLCIRDHAAIKAASFLSLDDQIVSIENMLKEKGILRAKADIEYKNSQKRFEKFTFEGKCLKVENEK